MNQDLVALAFAAGLVAALNPCGFAMLPAYLALVVRGGRETSVSAVGRALLATAAMTAGFVAVFGGFGLLTLSAATAVQRHLPFVTIAIGIALVGVGVWLVAGRELAVRTGAGARWAPNGSIGSMFGYGVGYAIASLSCTIGPFLAVTGAGLPNKSIVDGLLVYVAYAAGLALVVGALAVAAALAGTAVSDRLKSLLPYVNRAGGVLLILVGLYVGYYGLYEVRLLHANGDPADPLIGAAGRLQGWIAGWVHRHGAWPWLVVLGVLVLGALVWTLRRRGRFSPN